MSVQAVFTPIRKVNAGLTSTRKRERCSIGNKKQSHQQKDLGQGAGDIKVAGGARQRLLVLIPPKAVSSWWPTDGASLVAAIPGASLQIFLGGVGKSKQT